MSWAQWTPSAPLTLGVEEEVMLLDPATWKLSQAVDEVLPALAHDLAGHFSAETHAAALELSTRVQATAAGAAAELAGLRSVLAADLGRAGLRAAAAGTHPAAQWHETQVSAGARYQLLHGTMRELARREPTFALHVHVGVADPELAIRLLDRMRAHVPLLLALSANSPFWQGRDSGLASVRTPIFQGFPRVGLPRRFGSYDAWVSAVEPLISAGAFPEPTFLWWDLRPQPRLGTLEIRVMDAQSVPADTAALVALTQCLVACEAEEGLASATLVAADEVLEENRFLAARDGSDAQLVDPVARRRVPVRELLASVLAALRPYAEQLDCADELADVERLAADPPAARQRAAAAGPGGIEGVAGALSADFAAPTAVELDG